MKKLDEREIIRILASRLGIRELDDVARVGRKIVIKCDMLVAKTDVPPAMEPWQVARKNIVSCASDLASKGARPLAAMVSLGIPRGCTRAYVEGLADGFARASRVFGVSIVGGDTNEASDLVIDCCMIGTLTTREMPTRGGARVGDIVVLSGPFGLPAAGLSILLHNARAAGTFRRHAIESVLDPIPRQRFGAALAKFFSSSIDSSDGLAISLYELAERGGVDIVIDSVPAARGLEDFARANNIDAGELVFHGGEEFEIVVTIPRSKLKRAESAAKKARVDLCIVGNVQRGKGRVFAGKRLLENRGYVHFSSR
ncbi:MAG: thiamine-phosphate kinase [Nitrososphaera sp.]